jgi:hypothetical protein
MLTISEGRKSIMPMQCKTIISFREVPTMMMGTLHVSISILTLVLSFVSYYSLAQHASGSCEASYLLIGVSGTLQDGFPLRDRLDYTSPSPCNDTAPGDENKHVPAILIGKALVRGFKAYLDIKEPEWREFREDPPQVPNAVVMPTGCHEHANIYWIYAVDSRQVNHILAGEPRFLSISPNTGLLDLTADETDEQVKRTALYEIRKQGKTDESVVAVPLVTGVWFHSSYVESPTVKTKTDNTMVTSYDGSLALWAGVERDDLVVSGNQQCLSSIDPEHECLSEEAAARSEQSWEGVYKAIRSASSTKQAATRPDSLECQQRVRFGVGPSQACINYPFSRAELMGALEFGTSIS